jgi:hypothetical protein
MTGARRENSISCIAPRRTPTAHCRFEGPRPTECQPADATPQRSSVFVLALLTVVLCAALLAATISATSNRQLVILPYSGRQQLQELASAGLRIINYQENKLVAICSEWQVTQLRQGGFQPAVVATVDNREYLYLVYSDVAIESLLVQHTADAFAYTADAFIVRVDAEEAETMAMRGADIVRLPHAIKVPAEPLPAALGSPPASNLAIESLLHTISPTLLIHHVCKLQDRDVLGYCNELGTRYSFATAELGEAARYLHGTYESYGLDVTYDPFVFNSTPITNVVAELPGSGVSRNHIYVLSAHYDSISKQPFDAAPGADDNASGVAAVLEVARVLSQHSFPCTIRFVNFAGEEQGLIGSAHYAEQAAQRGDVIDGVLNLDMIAYESVPPNDHKVDIHAGTDPKSIRLADALVASISDFGIDLVPQVVTAGATWRSDHASFWSHGLPAVLGIEDMDDLNPHYHSTRDTRSRIRPQLMTEFTKAYLATLARLAAQSHEPPNTPTAVPSVTPTATVTLTLPSATPTPRCLYLPMLLRPDE